MKLPSKILWLAAHLGHVSGSIPLQAHDAAFKTHTTRASHIFASSHSVAQRQPTAKPALSHMYALSHTFALRQHTAALVLHINVSPVPTVVHGSMAMLPASIIITSTPGNSPTALFRHAAGILQEARITTVTSVLRPANITTSKPTDIESTYLPVLSMTSIVDELVTVTTIPLITSSIPVPQSQVQGSTTTEPSFVLAPLTTATSILTPTSTFTSTSAIPLIVPSSGSYSYLGCFREGLTTRALGEAFFPNDLNTIEKCTAACFPYVYAGVEFSRECWCGNIMEEAVPKISDEFCNMPCAGDEKELCGGIVALGIYIRGKLASSDPNPTLKSTSRLAQTSVATSRPIMSSTAASSAASTGPASTPSLFSLSKTSLSRSDPEIPTASSSSPQIFSPTPIFSSPSISTAPVQNMKIMITTHMTETKIITISPTGFRTRNSTYIKSLASLKMPSPPSGSTFTTFSSVATFQTPLIPTSAARVPYSFQALPSQPAPTTKHALTSTIKLNPRPLSGIKKKLVPGISTTSQGPSHTALLALDMPISTFSFFLLSTPNSISRKIYGTSTHAQSTTHTSFSTQAGFVFTSDTSSSQRTGVGITGIWFGLWVLLFIF
ncbi:uncharacterized protein RSE6_12877 [Rhynchosporium secalis]|uniref:WSC domain-containing protein n=1 Tax=Rhynchosporium secalis TaxID=38038 RepID=A0A1E1MRH8_RHYSE|nr:uncharacterized protein RSE6_12877 [Rhynchosporium secalis]